MLEKARLATTADPFPLYVCKSNYVYLCLFVYICMVVCGWNYVFVFVLNVKCRLFFIGIWG